MLKFGIISEVKPSKGLARVNFDEDEIVSAWLPAIVRKSKDEKESYPFDVNEHVACLMDEHCENGVILGAIYSDKDSPAITSKDEFGVQFSNGDTDKYNRATRTKTVKVGTSEITITVAGHTMKKGTESLKGILTDLINAIMVETHNAAGVPTTPPLNVAQYQAVLTKVESLFES